MAGVVAAKMKEKKQKEEEEESKVCKSKKNVLIQFNHIGSKWRT